MDDLDEATATVHFRGLVRDGRLTLSRMFPQASQSIADANIDLELRLQRLTFAANSAFFYLRLKRRGDHRWQLLVESIGSDRLSGRGLDLSRQVILRWAAVIRIGTVAFEDEFYEVPAAVIIGSATVECPLCGHVQTAADELFWVACEREGYMPAGCMPCGALLPQADVPAEYPRPTVEVSLKPELEGAAGVCGRS